MLRAAGDGREIFIVIIEKLSFTKTAIQITLVFGMRLCDMKKNQFIS